jgi:prepilin-type N-terminal cleavage/methylation domain-containing protein
MDIVESEESGYSLVECLIATALLAVAVVSLAQLVAMALASAANARELTRCTIIAQQKLEELRSSAARAVASSCPSTSPCVAYLDRNATVLGVGGSAPDGTTHAVWWLATDTGSGTWVVEVAAAPWRIGRSPAASYPDGARFVLATTVPE